MAFTMSRINKYSVNICEEHQKSFEWICTTCEEFLCAKCKSNHPLINHQCDNQKIKLLAKYNIDTESDIRNSLSRSFNGYVNELQKREKKLDEDKQEYNRLHQQNNDKFRVCESDLKEKLLDKFNEAVDRTFNKVNEKYDQAMYSIKSKEKELQTRKQTLVDMLTKLENKEEEVKTLGSKPETEHKSKLVLFQNQAQLSSWISQTDEILRSDNSFNLTVKASFDYEWTLQKATQSCPIK